MSVPTSVSFWSDVLFSLTVVTGFSFRAAPLVDFCFVLLLLLGVTEITSEVSEFCSTTTEAAPFLFEGTSDGAIFSIADVPSLPAGNESASSQNAYCNVNLLFSGYIWYDFSGKDEIVLCYNSRSHNWIKRLSRYMYWLIIFILASVCKESMDLGQWYY